MSTKRTQTTSNPDPEATTELPTIDLAVTADLVPVPAVPAGTSELAERLREVEQRLDQKSELVRELEAQLAQSAERLGMLESQLEQSRARQAELEAQLEEARAYAQMQTQLVVESRAATVRHHEQQFTELRNRTERQLEALTSWQGFRSVSDAMLAEAEARSALLESRISSLTDSMRALKRARPRGGPEGESELLKAELTALNSRIGALQAELAGVRKQPPQSKRKSEAPVTRKWEGNVPEPVEPPFNASVVMYGDQWEYKEEPDESGTGELEQLPAPAKEKPLRALVRQDGDGELIYPVGRRTTIGREPDNDVQIDAHNVSRHHAVLLVGPEDCFIEDLNSTNGVTVNGHRVTRQVLRDGDTVTIGKTEFKFLQRT